VSVVTTMHASTPLLNRNKKDAKGTLESQHDENSIVSSKFLAPASVAIFILLGVCQTVSTRATVNADGSLPYDVSAAVLISEIIKLVVTLAWLVSFDRSAVQATIRSAKTMEFQKESFALLLVASLYAMQNQIAFLAISKLGASLYIILGNMKIVWTCIFMTILLSRRFSFLQWIAVGMLTASVAILKLPTLLYPERTEGDGASEHHTHDLIVGLMFMVISTCSSGLSTVLNELILKRVVSANQLPWLAKNVVLYIWGVLLNFLVWRAMGNASVLSCVQGPAVIPILSMTGMGLACSIILRYLDNVYRCFGACAQVLLTVIISRFVLPHALQDEPLGLPYVCALLLLVQAMVIYQNHEAANLPWYLAVASAGTLLVCVCCFGLDRHNSAMVATTGSIVRKAK